jgi:hypothetical protein
MPFLKFYIYILFLYKKLCEIFATGCSPIETSSEPTVRGITLVATEWWRVCLFHHAITGRFMKWPRKKQKVRYQLSSCYIQSFSCHHRILGRAIQSTNKKHGKGGEQIMRCRRGREDIGERLLSTLAVFYKKGELESV